MDGGINSCIADLASLDLPAGPHKHVHSSPLEIAGAASSRPLFGPSSKVPRRTDPARPRSISGISCLVYASGRGYPSEADRDTGRDREEESIGEGQVQGATREADEGVGLDRVANAGNVQPPVLIMY